MIKLFLMLLSLSFMATAVAQTTTHSGGPDSAESPTLKTCPDEFDYVLRLQEKYLALYKKKVQKSSPFYQDFDNLITAQSLEISLKQDPKCVNCECASKVTSESKEILKKIKHTYEANFRCKEFQAQELVIKQMDIILKYEK